MLKKVALAGLLLFATLFISTAANSRPVSPAGQGFCPMGHNCHQLNVLPDTAPKAPVGHGLCPAAHC